MGLRSRCLVAVMVLMLAILAPQDVVQGRIPRLADRTVPDAVALRQAAILAHYGALSNDPALPNGLAEALHAALPSSRIPPYNSAPAPGPPGGYTAGSAPDPLQYQAALTEPNGQAGDEFGFDVALSADGTTASVGVVGWNNYQGAAYVFMRNGAGWAEQAMLTAAGGIANSWFGTAVSLSDDGDTALIGAQYASGGGAAYVFVRSGMTWTEQTTLNNLDAPRALQFGSSVAISGDGNTAVIGTGAGDDYSFPQEMGASIYFRQGTSWSTQADFMQPTSSNSYFGANVTVSRDGTLALISAPGNEVVYVYARTGVMWNAQTTIGPVASASNYYFGSAMALNDDANEVLVGAMGLYGVLGAAFVFVRTASGWSEQAELEHPWSTYYGMDVALSADGNTALIGAEVTNYQNNGAAYLFTRSGTSWSLQAGVTDPIQNPSWSFGWRVALSRDGRTALVGADYAGAPNYAGVAYVYAVLAPASGATATATATVGPPTSTATATATATATGTSGSSITATVQSGWTLISPSLMPSGSFTASSLLDDVLRSGGGKQAALYALGATGWAPSLIAQANSMHSGQDYALQVGQGYLLYSEAAGSYTETGSVPAATPTWSLHAGWNLVGLPQGTGPLQASSVLSGVLAGSGGALAAIYGLAGAQWTPSLIDEVGGTLVGQDFALQPDCGYLLYTDTAMNYTPGRAVMPQAAPVRAGAGASAGNAQSLPAMPPLP